MRIDDSSARVIGARSDPSDDQHRVLPATGPRLSSVCLCDRHGRKHMEAGQRDSTELWRGEGARVFGGPAISPDGRYVAFSVRQRGQTLLYVMQIDGTNARSRVAIRWICKAILRGRRMASRSPRRSTITVSHISFAYRLDGRPPTPFVGEYSVDPAWSPDGRFVVYSGPDIGTTFSLKAVTAEAAPHPLPAVDPDAGRAACCLSARRTGARAPARRDPT